MAVSTDSHLANYFAKMANEQGFVVREAPRFDLDSYIQLYSSKAKLERLLHIGRSSVVLCIDALKAAVAITKSGLDVQRYRDAVDCLKQAAPNDSDARLDNAWIEEVTKANSRNIHRLDSELKGYKNNLVKESVRLTQEELGKQYIAMSNLEAATEIFTRMRADATTPKQVVDTGKQLIHIAIQRRDWVAVSTNIHKISGIQGDEEEKGFQAYARTTNGLACLGQEKYLEAAVSFLATDYGDGGDEAIGPQAIEHLSIPDVADYGGLLALATMSRGQLVSQVLENANFRHFLENSPHIRRAINHFVNGRYAPCLRLLESYRADYLLDIYLYKHVHRIFGIIRQKCIVQYLQPFSCVTIENMNQAFAVDEEGIEKELVGMIRDGALIDYRIDAIDKVVIKAFVNPRIKMQAAGLQMATNYENDVVDRLRRISIAAASLEVRGSGRGKAADYGQSDSTNEWYDSAQIVE